MEITGLVTEKAIFTHAKKERDGRNDMKKLSLLVLLIAIAVTGLSLYRIQDNGGFASGPWIKSVPLQNLSRAAEATAPSLVVIGQSKQEIQRLSPKGAVEAEIKHNGKNGDSRRDYTEAVVDGSNGIVVLDTVLDSYGLIVQSEQIIRYDEAGKSGELLYEWKGNGTSKRIGQLKGLQIRGNSLYFYITTPDKVSLMRLPLSGGQPEESFSFLLPHDRYLSEIKGTEPGEIYYTTKRGGIFQVTAQGDSQIIYPLASMDRTRKNFPERLSIDSDGKLIFIDRLLNAVTRMEPGQKYLNVMLDEASIQKAVPDAESYELMDILPTGDGGFTVVLSDRTLTYDNQKRLTGVLSQATYLNNILLKEWLIWGAAFAGLLLLIFALRLVYIHLMNRRFSLFFKQLIVTVPIIVVCMLLLSNFIYNSFSARMEDEMQRELSLLARNGQQIIDGDRLERLHSPEDYSNDDYKAIRGKMSFLFEGEQAVNRQGLYSTLYKYDDGKLYILMDDDDGVNMFKPFEMNEENESVRKDGVIRTGQWEDANGKWLYAIGPVYNSKHEVVGIYETGRDMSVLYQANQKIYKNILQNIVIITSILLVVILAATFLMLSTIRKLRRSVMDMADGNWDVEVRVKSRDEVGDLGEQFNRMARYIRQYIVDITQFSEASYRFVPQQFFKSLGKKGILDIHLGDQVQQNMSVMIANLRDFRKLSQTLTPMENFNFMNSFLRRFGPLVRKEDGLISKYLGAGFMALFPGYAEEALRTAIAIRQELTEYNAGRRRAGYVPVDIGIAVHRGPLMMGIIGEERRWEGNVISDGVHLTATLERLSEDLGASILVTRDLFEQLREPERFRHRSLGRITPEGQEEAIELIDVYDGDSEQLRQAKDRTKALFERGLMLCQEGRFYDARETFVEVIKQNRLDKAAKLYFYLCDEYFQKGTSTGWNGTLAV
ncbi:adenylate/guanylate cyclase domain-containing protein [Cohnella silvisoli]|uniref:Adenylate/guanylate cyclase domain-containing protein n=1 Tax=Cohnella silvisoli TaxID=2873699 RepID=A0ABV1L2Y9_9BACL|nr:adenylate/guanylate cyclase domain-containing protein [Cohnella silvisoli]MCD9025813.1 HAMP domain-containing protein [Cohnella silvisoli]